MNCGTFQLQRIAAVMKRARTAAGEVDCANCGELISGYSTQELSRADYLCPGCDALVFILCGCTNERSCDEGCHWLEGGICSTHETELEAKLREAGVTI